MGMVGFVGIYEVGEVVGLCFEFVDVYGVGLDFDFLLLMIV